MKHSPVVAQPHDGETSRNVHSIWRAILNGLHLLIVALNQLNGECQSSNLTILGNVIRFRREVQFRHREWRRGPSYLDWHSRR
ncbi:MAG: hypothetical protein JWQ49_5857 [Edaphobacter sp.]|nr:hypothetical protein [Edaphobacter sp.]